MDDPSIARMGNDEVRDRLAELDTLLAQLEESPGPASDLALDAVQILVQLYGEALARVLALAGDKALCASMLDDELLCHLLVLHGLHPDSLEARVAGALESVKPYVRSHGGDLEFAGIENGVAVVRLSGSCDGCASSVVTLESAVTDAVLAAAPELSGVRALSESAPGSKGLIPPEALLRKPSTTHAKSVGFA